MNGLRRWQRSLLGWALGACLLAPMGALAAAAADDPPPPLPTPVASPPAASPLPAWIEVRLPDGRSAWAPTQDMLVPASVPQPPDQVVATARRLMGVPYRWGGQTPNGVDCSGFVQEVFSLNGHRLPRPADEQFNATASVTDPQPGDLVFFTTYLPGPSHVGIYVGDGRFVHASSSRGVVESSLSEAYYARRFLGTRRLPEWMPAASAPAPSPSTPASAPSPPGTAPAPSPPAPADVPQPRATPR